MRALVVYYSRDGHTKAVAQEIAGQLGSEIEEIVDLTNRRGFVNWFLAGRDAFKKRLTEIGPVKSDPAQYDLVVIGTPVWAWNMAPAVRTYLTQNKEKIKTAAFFGTQGGSGGQKAFGYMAEILGLKPKAILELNSKELAGAERETKIAEFVSRLRA